MHLLFTIIVTFFAGMGAGLGTGFAGMSAAAVISPILITFLGIDPYMAVGIALSSDVLASAVSAYTYGKNKNLDIKNGLIMMVTVLIFTVVGSYISSLVPSATMGNFSVFMTFLLGIKFIVRPVMTTKEAMQGVSAKKRAMQSVICGIIIGFICGFIGAGGGMMMLLILTSVLGYELKTAVGTSVFIMTFTALTGAVSHFTIGGPLRTYVPSGIIGAGGMTLRSHMRTSAGGGMMMLLILTSVLGYELKTAVGTSVFIMTFTAFTGAVSHFAIGGLPDPAVWILCIIFTLIWARIAAVLANKATPKTLNRATGVILVVLGVVVMAFSFLS